MRVNTIAVLIGTDMAYTRLTNVPMAIAPRVSSRAGRVKIVGTLVTGEPIATTDMPRSVVRDTWDVARAL